jgi:hypothetical protein
MERRCLGRWWRWRQRETDADKNAVALLHINAGDIKVNKHNHCWLRVHS